MYPKKKIASQQAILFALNTYSTYTINFPYINVHMYDGRRR